uniref:F-box domain-containing protein n=1 Tax=Strongyloides papillosus TaxID=174720 RepID=A0A0N5BVB3_STREA
MDTQEISFINIIEIGLVRKKIFEYLPSFKDINRLASTCWKLKNIIKNEKIIKNIFYDDGRINTKFAKIDVIREFTDVQEESKFEDCAFIENFDYIYYGGKKDEKFDRDRFICNNTVEISFLTGEREVSSEKKDLTILKINDQRFGSSFSALLLVLPYLHHENIETIIIPINIFSNNINKYNGLLNNLFDGFPKLYKLEIHLSFGFNVYNNFYHNNDAIDGIMEQLSRKKNATIHFYYFDDRFSCTVDYFLVFFEIAMKYRIKVTMDDETLFLLKDRNISNILKRHNYSIEQHKVVGLELTFVKHHTGISKDEIEIFHKNFKYLIQLLPSSVKRLYLYGIPKLTYDITRTIERYMPNIEVLSLCNVSFEETDCLCVFKKLQVVAIRSDIPVKIPGSVKLFAINTMESPENDIGQKLIDEYSDKFSKRLTDNNGKHIYFKNFNDWRCYKHILQIENTFYRFNPYF